MKKTAVFPGSFDPMTNAHLDITRRASKLFNIVFLVSANAKKNCMFSVEERKAMIESVIGDDEDTKVEICTGLVSNYCYKNNIDYIIRGLRYSNAGEELDLANIWYETERIQTIFFPILTPQYKYLSSSRVRDYIRHKGDWEYMVPHTIYQIIKDKINKNQIQ